MGLLFKFDFILIFANVIHVKPSIAPVALREGLLHSSLGELIVSSEARNRFSETASSKPH